MRYFRFEFICMWLLATSALADTKFTITKGRLPKRFYHWIYREQLNQDWRVSQLSQSGNLPLPWMQKKFLVVNNLPALADHPGLFVWTHPVTGMATGPKERYGDVVIMMESVASEVNIMELETESGGGPSGFGIPNASEIEMSGVDAIHHVRKSGVTGKVSWEEWIITNSHAIEQFTVNPKFIKRILQPELEKIKQGKKFTNEELHFKNPGREQIDLQNPLFNSVKDTETLVIPILEAYMKRSASEFPKLWLKSGRRQNIQNGCPGVNAGANQEEFENGVP